MRPQVRCLPPGQPESEVFREARLISSDLLIEYLRRNVEEGREFRSKHHLTPADTMDLRLKYHSIHTIEGGKLFRRQSLLGRAEGAGGTP